MTWQICRFHWWWSACFYFNHLWIFMDCFINFSAHFECCKVLLISFILFCVKRCLQPDAQLVGLTFMQGPFLTITDRATFMILIGNMWNTFFMNSWGVAVLLSNRFKETMIDVGPRILKSWRTPRTNAPKIDNHFNGYNCLNKCSGWWQFQ